MLSQTIYPFIYSLTHDFRLYSQITRSCKIRDLFIVIYTEIYLFAVFIDSSGNAPVASVASLTVTAESGGASVSTARMSGGGFSGLCESCNLSVRQAKLLSKKRAAEELELARYARCTSDNWCYPKHDLLLRISDVAAYNINNWHDITAIKEMIMMCHWWHCSSIHLQLSCNSY